MTALQILAYWLLAGAIGTTILLAVTTLNKRAAR